MKFRITAAIAAGAVMLTALTACSSSTKESAGSTGTASGKSLTIGIKFDQPGLGLKNPDGTFSGFDVDVARYVAGKLGADPSHVTFKEVKSADRENFIEHGDVDFVVATYSITDARKQKVDFAGPYFIAHQDLLVKAGDTSITGPQSLTGNKILCSVKGSTSAQNVKAKYAKQVQLQEYGTYSDCVDALLSGAVNAVTTDDVILAGYAAQHPGKLTVVGQGFSDERYGIGVKKGDQKMVDTINDALRSMVSDGSWAASLKTNVGPSGYTIPSAPTIG